ncbi:helix-turn-helix domain-containing protein [Cytobacillus firmus]|uniref:helix-turn-helix domain-containing protein n=1 Tax=Cytobacillus firmus TaxID=1399 RepID=UPI001CFE9F78|nr:helix-turn-helix domain-containing protein [Cytobacillus firmus]
MSEKKNFTMVENSLWDLYTKLPKFNGFHIALYGRLRHRFNANYGYAFPSQISLAHDLGVGRKKIGEALKILEECGLVKIDNAPGFNNNNVYIVNDPIESEEEFLATFSDALATIEKNAAELEKEAASVQDFQQRMDEGRKAFNVQQQERQERHSQRATKAAEKTAAIIQAETRPDTDFVNPTPLPNPVKTQPDCNTYRKMSDHGRSHALMRLKNSRISVRSTAEAFVSLQMDPKDIAAIDHTRAQSVAKIMAEIEAGECHV